jgi:diaminopimelate epimerase
MKFVKFHGYGNDYLVFEAGEISRVASLNDFARSVCERHQGAGADGVALIEKHVDREIPFGVRIFNADGSEAAMSGNGTRCAVAYLYDSNLWAKDELRISTRAGVKLYRLRERMAGGKYKFEAEIGRPRFGSAEIPMRGGEPLSRVLNYPLEVGDEIIKITALQMCNPNCCVFVDDFDRVDWRRIGARIEKHEQFPERINVEFIRVRDPKTLEVRVWERGVGETQSSGTGACAATVASVLNNLVERRVTVEMSGGAAEVEWRAEDGEVTLTGMAEIVYSGEWKGEA